MFGSIDGSGQEAQHQQLVNYTSNCSQTNFITSFLNDFETECYNFNNFDSNHFDSNHFDSNHFDSSEASSPPPTPDIISSFASFPPESPVTTPPTYQDLYSRNYPIQSPTSSCSSMSVASPPITYQETRKKLIKDSLRLTIQSRRVAQGLNQIGSNDPSSNGNTESDTTSPDIQLSQADFERRRRRRERNKVAATKCRNKKKLHSVQLVQESESLEVNNAQMRKEISQLQKECQQLINLLNSHESMCKLSISFNNFTNFINYDENNNNDNNFYNNLSLHQI